MAAGLLLVKEAGGLFQAMEPNGNPLTDGDVIAANGPAFDAFAKIIRGN